VSWGGDGFFIRVGWRRLFHMSWMRTAFSYELNEDDFFKRIAITSNLLLIYIRNVLRTFLLVDISTKLGSEESISSLYHVWHVLNVKSSWWYQKIISDQVIIKISQLSHTLGASQDRRHDFVNPPSALKVDDVVFG
jgi:hypothetical protein